MFANIVDELAKRGHEVTLVAQKDSMTPEGGRLIEKSSLNDDGQLNARKEFDNINSAEVTEAMQNADIVHSCENFHFSVQWVKEVKKSNHFIQHLISNDAWNIRIPMNVICISQTHRQHMIHNSYGFQQLPFPPYVSNVRGIHIKDARVVCPDIDLEKWKPKNYEKGDYWIWFSRFNPDKGVDDFIEIARRCPNEKFKMFGAHKYLDHADYFYRGREDHPEPYEKMIKETPNIDLLEEDVVADMGKRIDIISRAKGFIFPVGLRTNFHESFGLVILEALALGTPVITTPYGSAPDIVEHGKTGFICSDVESMIERMSEIDKINPHTCRSEAGNYRKGKQAEAFLNIYKSILEGVSW